MRSSAAETPGAPAPRVLVIGYGNTLRGDDAFGWRVARAFAEIAPDLEVRAVQQLTPELAEAASRYDVALFVDAAADGEPGSLRCREVPKDAPESELSHHLTAAALLCLARRLYGCAPEGVEITVCGASFEVGGEMSARVAAELPRAVRLVSELAANPARARAVTLRRHAPPHDSPPHDRRRDRGKRVRRDPES